MEGCLLISIASIIALSVLLNPLNVLSESCSTWTRCSTNPDITYGLIGNSSCRVFRNPCMMLIENCDRAERNETLITPSTKKECQPFCPNICPMYILQFCGEYLKEKMTFGNECVMNRYNCKSGKLFQKFSEGPCKKS